MPKDHGPILPHHQGNIVFRRPDERDNPSYDAPTQEKVQQKNCQSVTFPANQSDERRQKIQQKRDTEAKTEKWKKEY
ncbi:MAG TPA: hypothetical protein VGS78_07360 [Candidatus Sulfotelmatobacter sp.]|nr:hypothetical protein [Candidatus Sulfotelmatobacter sp.]